MLYYVLALIAVVAAKNHNHDHNNPTHFAHWLAHLEKSDEFKTMSLDDRVQFSNLVMAAESGPDALTKALDSLTFVNFIKLIDEFKPDDIAHLEKYFTAHMQNNPVKRRPGHGHGHTELSAALLELHTIHDVEKHLDAKDQDLFNQFKDAVNKKTLTQFLNDGNNTERIFILLSDIDKDNTFGLDKLIETHLKIEAAIASATTVSPV